LGKIPRKIFPKKCWEKIEFSAESFEKSFFQEIPRKKCTKNHPGQLLTLILSAVALTGIPLIHSLRLSTDMTTPIFLLGLGSILQNFYNFTKTKKNSSSILG
jgi:hypothetical protein